MKIDLIIKDDNDVWQYLEVNDNDIVMTKTFSDMEDPASIDAAYTLNCDLPFTKHNTDILGSLYRLDYVKGNQTFDQRQKYKCKVLHNEEVIYEGDFVLDRTIIGDDITNNVFNCTIYDELYSVFKKLDYEIANPAESYDGMTDKRININVIDTILTPQLAVNSWKNSGCLNNVMSYTNGVCDYRLKSLNTENEVCSFFGFLPTYRTNDDIDTEKYLVTNNDGTAKFSNVFDSIEVPLSEIYGNFPHNIYPECTQQVWKSYDLKPYVWYSSYIQFIISEIYRVTGYKVDMTTDFFNPNNPYYKNLIRTLKYAKTDADGNTGSWKTISTMDNTWKPIQMTNDADTYRPASRTISAGADTRIHFNTAQLDENKKYRLVFNADATVMNKMDTRKSFRNCDARINKYCQAYANVTFKGYENTTHSTAYGSFFKDFNFYMEDCRHKGGNVYKNIEMKRVTQNIRNTDYENHTSWITFPNSMSNYFYFDNNGNLVAGLDYSGNILGNDTIKPDSSPMTISRVMTKQEIQDFIQHNVDCIEYDIFHSYGRYSGANFVAEPQYHFTRTMMRFTNISMELQEYQDPKVTIQDLFGDDFNILEEFTKFIKVFNLVCKLDVPNNKIILYERGEYFNENNDGRTGWEDKIEDWTEYINIQENLEHTAILSDYKDLLFTYEDRDTANNVKSRAESSYNAGTTTYDLALPVNTDSKNYLEGLYNSYIGIVEANWLYDCYLPPHSRTKHPKAKTPAIYIDNNGGGEALEDVDGQLLFRMEDNYQPSDYKEGYNDKGFSVASDTPYEIENDKKFMPFLYKATTYYEYIEESDELPRVNIYYPKDINAGTSYCSEWVDRIGNAAPNPMAFGVFDMWHRQWNDLLYGYPQHLVPSIKLTAYFHIPLEVYKQFDFSHLIKIENNIYLVLKIDEYCFGNEVMKATLLQLRGVNNLIGIDPVFDNEYLIVTPNRFALSPAPTTPKQIQYFVYSSNMSAVTETQLTKPNWIATWNVVSSVTVSPTIRQITVEYTTNSNYPTTKQAYTGATEYEDTDNLMTDTVEISNVVRGINVIDDTITVDPTHTMIPNNTNSNSILYTVTTVMPFKVMTTNGNVLNNPSYSVNQIDSSTYEVTVTFHNTTGAAGVQQSLVFYNTANNTATATVERDFDHQISIIPEKDGDDKLFLFDYTSLNDPLWSNFDFTIRANFNFVIGDWITTMTDGAVNEQCWDKSQGDIELWDVTGTHTKLPDPFQGAKNTVYKLRWRYPRKKSSNHPNYAGLFRIDCTDGGHPFRKQINVGAYLLNNGQTQPQ